VLSGEGSDELFGGYNQHKRFQLALRLNVLGRHAPWAADLAQKAAPHKTRFVHHLAVATKAPVFHGTGMIFEPHLAPQVFAEPIPPLPTAGSLREALFLDRRQRLADDILTLSDRATMLASVELRVPFITRSVAALAAGLPDRMLVRGRRRKYLLRKLADRYLPHSCVHRPKVGFDLPLAEWFRGPLRPLVYDTLAATWQRAFFRPGALERIVDWHMTGRSDFSDKLWAFVLLDQNVRAMRRLRADVERPTDILETVEVTSCA
jgi:asparagine synthase (glutamine-hydrolysing)